MTTQETPKTRRHFEPAFKLQVAKMVRDQGISLNQVCKDMNLVPSAVRRWVVQLDEEVAGRCHFQKATARNVRSRLHGLSGLFFAGAFHVQNSVKQCH